MELSANFQKAWALLLANEGGFSNNPKDSGGATMWGVTEAVARRNGYVGPMEKLPLLEAQQIAKTEYWDVWRCDELPLCLAFQVFDTAYNGGHPESWLQAAIGVPVIGGPLGDATIAAALLCDRWQAVAKFNALRLKYLASLNQPVFANGRMNRIARNISQGGLLDES